MSEADTSCIVTMQPFNNWRGALVVKTTDGRIITLNDDQYTSDSPVHEEFVTPQLTDIWWARTEEGEWYSDSHYEVKDCALTTPYHNVPGKLPSIKVETAPTVTSSTSTTSSTSVDVSPPLTFRVVTSDPLPPSTTTTTSITQPILPNTGGDVDLLFPIALITIGVLTWLSSKLFRSPTRN